MVLWLRLRSVAPACCVLVFFSAWLGLGAACGESPSAPDAINDAAVDASVPEDAVSGEPDANADAGPSGPCDCAGVRSGTRLRAIYGTESSIDGARSRRSEGQFFDTVRNEECEFPYDAPAGPTRCLPIRDYLTVRVFTDAACTAAIALSPASECAPSKVPSYLFVDPPAACAPTPTKLYSIVAETTAGDTFSLRQQAGGTPSCVKNPPLAGARYFTIGAEMDLSQFAPGTKSVGIHPDECACGPVHSGTRLEARGDVVVGADGARSSGYVSKWHDKELDVDCALERYSTLGPGWCVPESEPQVYWADAACASTPIFARAATCLPLPKYARTTSAPVSCGGNPPRLFPVGAQTTAPATYYSLDYDMAGTASCSPHVAAPGGAFTYYALGAELPASKLATYATTFEPATTGAPTPGETAECACGDTLSGSRLRAIYQMSRGADGTRQRDFTAWYDLTRKEDCHRAYDGTLRPEGHCFPAKDVLSYGTEYSDGACTLRVPFALPQACAVIAPKYLFSYPLTAACATSSDPHVYAVGAETTAPASWYDGKATASAVTCTAASGTFPAPGAKFYARGAEIPATDFAPLSFKRAAE